MEILNTANLSASWVEPLETIGDHRVPGGRYAILLEGGYDVLITGTAQELLELGESLATRFASIAHAASKRLEAERFLLTGNAVICPACDVHLALPEPGSIFGELLSTVQHHIFTDHPGSVAAPYSADDL